MLALKILWAEGELMRRRNFLAFVGGAAVGCPLASRAQQQAVLPVIGLLDSRSPDSFAEGHRAFRQGLKDAGFDDGDTSCSRHQRARAGLASLESAGVIPWIDECLLRGKDAPNPSRAIIGCR